MLGEEGEGESRGVDFVPGRSPFLLSGLAAFVRQKLANSVGGLCWETNRFFCRLFQLTGPLIHHSWSLGVRPDSGPWVREQLLLQWNGSQT